MNIGDISPRYVEEVREFLEDNKKVVDVSELTPQEFLDSYLKWNGIIGYTGDIILLMSQLGWRRR